MFHITIIAVGKIKKSYYLDAANEYLKRINPHVKIVVEEIKAEPFLSDADHNKAKKVEGERIIKCLNRFNESEIFLLDEYGKNYTSKELANIFEESRKHLVFVIGGALGFSDEVRDFVEKKISLSKMTFPHELARVIFLEQIYRIITIIQGKKYHY